MKEMFIDPLASILPNPYVSITKYTSSGHIARGFQRSQQVLAHKLSPFYSPCMFAHVQWCACLVSPLAAMVTATMTLTVMVTSTTATAAAVMVARQMVVGIAVPMGLPFVLLATFSLYIPYVLAILKDQLNK